MLLVPILILFFGAIHPLYMIPISVFFFSALTPFDAEEKGDLHYLYLSMPLTRRDVVLARFILSFIMFIFGVIVGRVLIFVFGFISPHVPFLASGAIDFSSYLAILVISYLLYALLMLMVFPVMFKFGYSKGKFISVYGGYVPLMFVIVIFAAWDASTTMVARRADSQSPVIRLMESASQNLVITGLGIMAIATIILLTAYLLSIRLYMKRDF